VHALFSGRGRQKSQSCRRGQPETLYELGHRQTFQRDSVDHGGAVVGRTWPDITETIARQPAIHFKLYYTLNVKHGLKEQVRRTEVCVCLRRLVP